MYRNVYSLLAVLTSLSLFLNYGEIKKEKENVEVENLCNFNT